MTMLVFLTTAGTESIQTIVKTEYSDVERVSYETETVDVTSNVATPRFSTFQSSPVDHQERGISRDERSPRKSYEEKKAYSKESEVVEEDLNPEETEFDVERVLEKQNTYDLFCPNCRSCITRTVILQRKERKLPDPEDGNREPFKCQTCFGTFILKGVWPFIVIEDASDPSDVPSPPGETQTVQVIPPPIPPNVGNEVVIMLPPSDTPEPPVVQPHQPREWDILKSIVYGGLIESITSLAVVSSAAGAGAATLNTLGLGLANLFGGLIVIAHNLRELKLKNEQPSQGTEQVDRYQEALGNKQHFLRHAVVAILSFIIFGCVAPITYAFSFRESDNRDYKLAAVAGASLLCIFLLAIGKAYVGKQAYFTTVLHYVIMGFMASGVSFLVGELIDKLLTKLGWFDSTSSLSGTSALETGTMQSGWASY